MKRLAIVLFLIIVLTLIVKVHTQPVLFNVNHPQLSAYTDPSQYPLLSAQCHMLQEDGVFAHLHMEVFAPAYAMLKLNQPIRYKFQIVTFRSDGLINPVWGYGFYGNWLKDIIWDATGTSTPPLNATDLHGVVTLTGSVTMDPSLSLTDNSDGRTNIPKHGWFNARHVVKLQFSNGNVLQTILHVPFYSVEDPSAPETDDIVDGRSSMFSRCFAAFDHGSDTRFGTINTEFHEPLPILAPITAPWTLHSQTYDYAGVSGKPPATYELHLDPDFHHDNPGTVLHSQIVPEPSFDRAGSNNTDIIDPASYTPGDTHKFAFIWEQPSDGATAPLPPGQSLWSLLVFNVKMGIPSAPPPPPPSPMPTQNWQNITPDIQQLFDSVTGALDSFRICNNGICTQVIH